ncbi:MAG: GntR family transcriptional regulator [Oscillospiraceae bacterium]|nr:GntR family transcriptional regulator [Oscillospiraceae bacterium]
MEKKAALEYQAIKNSSVVDAVKDWITDQLIKGNLRPGSRLPTEAELCANLGASRNSVREAIKQLEAYGVVYIKRAEGTFVSDHFDPKMLSPVLYSIILGNDNWADFVDLRRAIDIGTLYALIGRNPSPEDLAPLADALQDLEDAVKAEQLDVEAITDADCRFHNVIIGLTNNPQLITLSDYINRVTVPSRRKTTETVISNGEIESYAYLHRQLYEIIEHRDKAGIEQAVLNHYVFWEKFNS